MKIWSFLRWKYQQTTFGDICWWAGAALIGASFAIDSNFLLIIGLISWCCILANFLISHYCKEYREFVEEQNQLFEIIKHSDQK